MRHVLMAMDRGSTLLGSSLGDARLVEGRSIGRVAQKTHAGLIRRGLLKRQPGAKPKRPGDTVWVLTERGLAEVTRSKTEAQA